MTALDRDESFAQTLGIVPESDGIERRPASAAAEDVDAVDADREIAAFADELHRAETGCSELDTLVAPRTPAFDGERALSRCWQHLHRL